MKKLSQDLKDGIWLASILGAFGIIILILW